MKTREPSNATVTGQTQEFFHRLKKKIIESATGVPGIPSHLVGTIVGADLEKTIREIQAGQPVHIFYKEL